MIMIPQALERWPDRIEAKKELEPWIAGGFRLQKAGGSAIHRLWDAEENNRALWLLAPYGYDPRVAVPSAQSFVVQHNWAAAFEGATEFDAGDFRLPFDHCCFEFNISGKCVCAFVTEPDATKKAITVFVETRSCWVMPITVYHLHEGMWQPVVNGADDKCRDLPPLIAAQVRAICISLEADVAATETVERPEKLNRARVRRGKQPLPPYRVLYLNHRPRAQAAEGEVHGKVRLHFRRGHWRMVSEVRRTWVRWTLVGDPDLGFVDKEYRL
jgi:hypothetical protein